MGKNQRKAADSSITSKYPWIKKTAATSGGGVIVALLFRIMLTQGDLEAQITQLKSGADIRFGSMQNEMVSLERRVISAETASDSRVDNLHAQYSGRFESMQTGLAAMKIELVRLTSSVDALTRKIAVLEVRQNGRIHSAE